MVSGELMSAVLELVKSQDSELVTFIADPQAFEMSWPFVRQGLARIRKRQDRDHPDRATWRPEHIRAALIEGFQMQAKGAMPITELWLACPREKKLPFPVAFTVTQTTMDPFVHVPLSLFIWCSYHDPKDRSDAVTSINSAIATEAKRRGYCKLEAMTARLGLARRMAKFGWVKTMDCLELDLYAEKAG